MTSKNIIAYFKSPEEAQGAKKKLNALRVEDVSIDRFDGFPGDGSDRILNPITGDFPGLGYLTLGGDFDDPNASILASANVSASGLSDGGQPTVTGYDVVLSAVVDEQQYEKALKIVRDAGGKI